MEFCRLMRVGPKIRREKLAQQGGLREHYKLSQRDPGQSNDSTIFVNGRNNFCLINMSTRNISVICSINVRNTLTLLSPAVWRH